MLPKLYDEFSKNGEDYQMTYLGTINHCTKCQVKEVRNGAYTLSMETTENDDCAGFITSQKIIGAKANPFDPVQYFEIQKTERTQDGIIKVEAKHVKNFCFQICSEGDITAENRVVSESGTPKEVWDLLVRDYIVTTVPFTFASNISARKKFSLGLQLAETLGDILGGSEGSFLDLWGGEFHWDNYSITLNSARGSAKDYQIRYGSNISNAKQTESCENTFTHILPYGKVGVTGSNTKITFSAPLYAIPSSESNYTKVYKLDCTSLLESYEVGTTGQNYSTVKAAMTNYARTYAANRSLGKVSVSIDITLRAELDEMAQIGLCDTVSVILDNFGTTATAKITETTYDSLMERWDKLVVGATRVTVADMILNRKRYI